MADSGGCGTTLGGQPCGVGMGHASHAGLGNNPASSGRWKTVAVELDRYVGGCVDDICGGSRVDGERVCLWNRILKDDGDGIAVCGIERNTVVDAVVTNIYHIRNLVVRCVRSRTWCVAVGERNKPALSLSDDRQFSEPWPVFCVSHDGSGSLHDTFPSWKRKNSERTLG